MNKTKIDWCDMSWNPVTGCYHDCKYCYASNIANRFSGGLETDKKLIELKYQVTNREDKTQPYPYGFKPTFHEYRLEEPISKTKGKTIFVCSMADLFGAWVPYEWIVKIFEIVEKCPQHKFIFLTKNHERYGDMYSKHKLKKYLELENAYFGITITNEKDTHKLHYLSYFYERQRFISIEPFIDCDKEDPFELNDYLVNRVIIGAMTGKKIIKPCYDSLKVLIETCKSNNISIFMKDNLKKYWDGEFIQEGF